jgi:protein O-GlcNAc transferase
MTVRQQFESALSHHRAGRLIEAEKIYRQVVAREPDHAEALNLLGALAGQAGRLDMAVELIRRAIRVKPDFAEAHGNLGVALEAKGRFDEAIASHRQAIRLKPDRPESHYNLGNALREAERPEEAIASYREAVRLKPDYAKAHKNLGFTLESVGRIDEAIGAYRQAIRLDPLNPEAYRSLGLALTKIERIDEAMAAYRQAIGLQPDYAEAHSNLGCALKSAGRLDEAVTSYRRAIGLKRDHAKAHSNLVLALHYQPAGDARIIHEELRRWNEQHAEPLGKFIQPHSNDRDPERRLRIGYVSADFRNHSVSRFLLPLFRHHDHGAYEIICYSDVLKSDAMTERLRAFTDGWQIITWRTDERVAEKVREDKIDILVDLSGHTAGNRLCVFARKPAPVQVSYLGYPGTTGLSEIDYCLTDSLTDPPGEAESLYNETPLRLPVCNWCFSAPDDAPRVGPLPAEADGSVHFGTFNNLAKASPVIMDLWAAILIAIPSSRLIIKSHGLGEKSVRERIQQCFASRGVDPGRLDLRGHEPNDVSHLDAYNQMDIALDTFPYHGTTTTCEALWMGVPVVSLAGRTHVSRVGVSLLSCVGLPELIARTPDQYIEIAANLATDLSRLAELRRTLRPRMQASGLMDAPRFARDVEAVYRKMWRIWCERSGNSGL